MEGRRPAPPHVCAPRDRVRTTDYSAVLWKRWDNDDYSHRESHGHDITPHVCVRKGAGGPAGQEPPAHPPTSRELVLLTDSGCVENAHVGGGEQLAGAGCVAQRLPHGCY